MIKNKSAALPAVNYYPANEDLEQVVLGALMIEREALPRVVDRLEEDLFHWDDHKLIYRAIRQLYDQGKMVDIITVTNRVLELGGLQSGNTPYYVTLLTSKVLSSAHLEDHVALLRDLNVRRCMIVVLTTCLCKAQDMTWDVYDVLTETIDTLGKLEHGYDSDTMRDLPTLIADSLRQGQWRMANQKDGITGIPTGLAALDHLLAGWQPTELIVIGARPATGKTSLTVYMAWVAAQAGYKVVYYSLEMAGERLADKWIVAESNISAERWRKGTITPDEDKSLAASVKELTAPAIHVDDCSVMSMERIKSKSRMLQQKGLCDIVFIDYLQIAQITGSKASYTLAADMGDMAEKAKAMAKELNVPVVLLSQLNRESEKRMDKRPIMADLRESGDIEQVADVVALIHNPSKSGLKTEPRSGYPAEGLGVLIIEKNRNGATGDVYFGYNESMTRFGDYEPPKDWISENSTPLTAKEIRERRNRNGNGRLPPAGATSDK